MNFCSIASSQPSWEYFDNCFYDLQFLFGGTHENLFTYNVTLFFSSVMVAAPIVYYHFGSLDSFVSMKVQSMSFHLYNSKSVVCKEDFKTEKRGRGRHIS